MKKTVLVLLLCVAGALAQDSIENAGVKIALKLYDDCSANDEGFSLCLKKKAVTFLDRLGRMDKFSIAEGVVVTKAEDATKQEPAVTEEQLDSSLPRSADAKDDALNNMLVDKVTNFIGSRTVEIALPKISPEDIGIETGRKGSGGGGGGGKGGMKGMMGGMMMGLAAKMMAMIPVAIAGLFLLAGKALITAKIALLISGLIAIKKLFAAKQSGGGHSSGWQSGGGHGGGGWQSGGGGWDKRSLNVAQDLAYNSQIPQ